MKKNRKIVSIALVLLMILSTGSVFAYDDLSDTRQTVKNEEQSENSESPNAKKSPQSNTDSSNAQGRSGATQQVATDAHIVAIYYTDENTCSMVFAWEGEGTYKVFAEDKRGNKTPEQEIDDNIVKVKELRRGEVYNLNIVPTDTIVASKTVKFKFLTTKVLTSSENDGIAELEWVGPHSSSDLSKYKVLLYKNAGGTDEIELSDLVGRGQLKDIKVQNNELRAKVVGLSNEVYYSFVIVYDDAVSPLSREVLIGERPADVQGFRALSSQDAIMLKWKPSAKAKTYEIRRSDGRVIRNIKDTKFRDTVGIPEGTSFSYQITAVNGNRKSLHSARTTGSSISRIHYVGQFRSTTNLTDGYRVYKNNWFRANGYGGGAYTFIGRDGRTHRVSYKRVKNVSADNTNSFNYSKEDAEELVTYWDETNAQVHRSRTFIWASLYTQHLYYLSKDSSGKWHCIDDWEICSGKAVSPSPSSASIYTTDQYSRAYGKRVRRNRIDKDHGSIFLWWTFYQTGNAFHSYESGHSFGFLASGGCIRNPSAKAQFIYHNLAYYSPALVY